MIHPAQHIAEFLLEAEHSVKLLMGDPLSEDILQACIRQVEKGVSVELVFSKAYEQRLRNDPFLFNKCIILYKKGGELFLSERLKNQAFCINDYAHVLGKEEAGAWDKVDKEEQEVVARRCLKRFQQYQGPALPYLHEESDLEVELNISDEIVLKGDEVKLSWNVKNADTTIFQSLGEVAPSGTKKIRPGITTIFKIGAYNQVQSRLKTVCAKVYDHIDITYDLSFFNIRTKSYTSLVVADQYPHVFGVARGNQVKLEWRVAEAQMVNIRPFGVTESSGAHEFTPESSMEVTIEVRVLDHVFNRTISIHVFPIPIMKDKLVSPLQDFYRQDTLQLPSEHSELTQSIRENQQKYQQSLQGLLKRERQKYDDLNQEFERILFDNPGNKYNLREVNKKALTALEKKHSGQPHIVKVIRAIKTNYE